MKTLTFWLKLLLALLVHNVDIGAYNIDLPSYVRHQQTINSMFGFSISFHKSRGEYSSFNSLIVGAPKYDTSKYQKDVEEAGAVFRCSMQDDECHLVPFDSEGNRRNSDMDVIDEKSHQWLGATIATGRDNEYVVACAPRYVFHSMMPTRTQRNDPIGICFTSHDFIHFQEISPCRTNNHGFHRQGSCQAGFSAAINSNGTRLYIGAPGSWYWQGQAYSIPADAEFPFKPPLYQPFGTGGRTASYDITWPENAVFSTAESSSQNDDSYLGYSMINGDFNGDKVEDVAIGMPRGANLLGKIVVNHWNMANIFNITGRQIGEYFGYALATSDVDGDGLDDLIIGAPMYTEPGNVEGKYDVGRVYVLVQRGNAGSNRWTSEYIRDGFNTKGRFGLALTTLGDVNRDGYGDFAVGAPYDGPEGRGVVYIYHGSVHGPLAKPSQIIKSEDLVEGAPYPRTFGFALSGGVDMDGNTYPDLAVGAYASDKVYIFKARPVAAVTAQTTFANPSKLINLEERTCQLRSERKAVSCMELTTCWSFTGKYLPENLAFEVSWLLDAKKLRNPRMFFLRDEGKNIRTQTIQLQFERQFCLNETVYVVDNVQDKLTPLEVEARYNLLSSQQSVPVLVRRKRATLEPVIDQNREIVLRDAINIQKNCGADNICEPDLQLQVKTVDKYLFGSPEPLSLEVLITNANEDAFEAAFYMNVPRELNFKKLQQLGDKSDTPITCTAPSEANNLTLKCDIGNPLQGRKMVHFKVILTPAQKFGRARSYDFYMEANSTNLERNSSLFDNVMRRSIGIWVDTDLDIKGNSYPDFQLYKASDYKAVENATMEEDLGPQVVHIYDIRNNRPSTIEEAVVLIHYPYETLAGEPLMYVLNQPETGGNIRCDPHGSVNYRNLRLNQNLARKSYLEEKGATSNNMHYGATAAEAGGGHLEISDSSHKSGGVGVTLGGTVKKLTPKEKELLERNDALDVSGDASFVHTQRINQAAAEREAQAAAAAAAAANSGGSASGSGGTGGASWSWSSSWNSSGTGAQPNADYTQPRMQQLQLASVAPKQAAIVDAHSTHGHIQMAPAGYQQSSNMRPQQQSQLQLSSSSSGGGFGDKLIYPGRSGFQAGTLDLGTLNRGNVDNELQNRGSAGLGGGSSFSSSSSSAQYGRPNGLQQQQTTVYRTGGNAKPYYGRENGDVYDEDSMLQQHHVVRPQQQQWSSSSSSSAQRRYKREASEEPRKVIDLNSPCQAAKCETLRCVIKNLGNDDAAWVAIRARMVAKTMENITSNAPLSVSTLAVARITLLPFVGEPKDEIVKSHEIFYKAEPEPTPVPDVVELWVVVLAACAGALILLLLVLLLYKCGFFKRNRPTDHSQERQPLRNGYHGDEHL